MGPIGVGWDISEWKDNFSMSKSLSQHSQGLFQSLEELKLSSQILIYQHHYR